MGEIENLVFGGGYLVLGLVLIGVFIKVFLDYRRKLPTPYMEKLRVPSRDDTADPDTRVLTDEDLRRAVEEGEKKAA